MPQQPPIYDADGNRIVTTETGQSALVRFGTSAWANLDPIAAVQGLYGLVRHPIDSAALIARTSRDNAVEAFDAAREGRYVDAAKNAVGAVPLVGPAVENVVDQVQAGDYAGAAGSAVGLAVPVMRPLKSLGAVGTAAARRVAPAATARAAARLGTIAESKVVAGIAPMVGANKTRIGRDAAKVAPALLERGLTNVWSREGVHAGVKVALDAAGKKLDDAADARPSWKSLETDDVVKALEAKKVEIQAEAVQASKWPRKIDDDGNPVTESYGTNQTSRPIQQRVAAIDKAIQEVRGLGPTTRYEALRKLRAGWDEGAKPVYSPAVTPDYVANKSAQLGAADVTGAIREFLAGKDPGTAAANAEWSLLKKAKSVLDATEEIERVRPNRGGKIMSRVSASIVGSQVAGLTGAIVGYLVAPAAEVSIGMGVTTKLKLATQLDKVASAIRSGNAAEIGFYAGQLKRTAGQVGILFDQQQDGTTSRVPAPPEQAPDEAPPDEMTTLAPRKRARFEDGSVWEKAADGTIRRVQ